MFEGRDQGIDSSTGCEVRESQRQPRLHGNGPEHSKAFTQMRKRGLQGPDPEFTWDILH